MIDRLEVGMKVGFIGIGQMGAPMAMRLIDAGHVLTIFNRTLSAAQALAERGARIAGSPAETLDADVVVTMLADDTAVSSIWLAAGLARKTPAATVHLNMATTSLGIARELASAHASGGSSYISAPVFGRPSAAAQGQLDVIAAGPGHAIERCQPLFQAMAKQVFVIGAEPYKANAVKIARNFLLATVIESLGEAFALVRKAGVGEADFLNILTSTSLAAPVYRNYGKLIVDKAYEPAAFSMVLGMKDVELALSTANELGVPMPSATLIRQQIAAAIAAGRGNQDWAALAEHIAGNAGL
jgi:3-hydroxyisobutyrate dehydrogenase-like beta-hydroxyacid dehydrogenase